MRQLLLVPSQVVHGDVQTPQSVVPLSKYPGEQGHEGNRSYLPVRWVSHSVHTPSPTQSKQLFGHLVQVRPLK